MEYPFAYLHQMCQLLTWCSYRSAKFQRSLKHTFREASDGNLKGIMAATDKKLVSGDLNHSPASVTMHLDQTKVMADGMVRLFGWYDNEWGFSNRMLDIACYLSR